MALLNDYKIGADPEFSIINNGHLVQHRVSPGLRPWGIDHGGWVLEPHPKPDRSVRQVIHNLRVALNDLAVNAPLGHWRAGAFYTAPERAVTFGGHIHIDRPEYNAEQVSALDRFTVHLERLDVLPAAECSSRRNEPNHYGRPGDLRREHGHFEYRTMCSWLYSQRVAKLCLTGAKLIVADPAAVSETMGEPRTASLPKLRNFFERFRHKDDDVDWILQSGIMGKRLVVRPDRDLREVWRVIPELETPQWKAVEQPPHQNRPPANLYAFMDWIIMFSNPGPLMPIEHTELGRLYHEIRWQHGTALNLGPRLATVIGHRGDSSWPLGHDHRTCRISLGGQRYTYWVLPEQLASLGEPLVRTLVRRYYTSALTNGTRMRHLYFSDGLLYMLVNSEEVAGDWDEENYN